MYVVYVIQNAEGLLYKGFTDNLEQRMGYHDQGLGHWTKNRGPWKLVHSETFEDKTEALKREKFLKSGKGREFLKSIIGL